MRFLQWRYTPRRYYHKCPFLAILTFCAVSGTRRFLLFELRGQLQRLRDDDPDGQGPEQEQDREDHAEEVGRMAQIAQKSGGAGHSGTKEKSASPDESGLTLCSNSIRPVLYLNFPLKVKQEIPTTPNLSPFLGDIRPRSRRSEPPGKLRCVLTPSASLRARVPQFFSAVKGAPERHVRVAKPYDSPSALRHGATNRPKGHCGPSACQENCSAGARRRWFAGLRGGADEATPSNRKKHRAMRARGPTEAVRQCF